MKRGEPARSSFGAAVLVLALGAAAAQASCSGDIAVDPSFEESARCLSETSDLYQRRIAPLLATDRPKTCNQCHLSGVDMSLFVRDDMCETRACLLELGLVDTAHPDDSKVLAWIQRAHPDSDLITEQVIQEEYDGFKSFVERIATCGGESCAGVSCPATSDAQDCGFDFGPDGPTLVDEQTPCDALSIETAFRDNVYVWRDRCFPCHFTSAPQAAPDAPKWIDVRSSCDAGSITTLRNIEHGGYMDLDQPEQSLILRKPLPLDEGGIEHGGSDKFGSKQDEMYLSILSFIEYYSSCQSDTATP